MRDYSVFRDEPGFHLLFSRFRAKYRSLGRIGGTVNIHDFSDEEVDSVSGFFGVSPEVLKRKGTISLKHFEQRLSETNLAGVTLILLLEEYFGENLISKEEEEFERKAQKERFYQDFIDDFPILAVWFKKISKGTPDTRFIANLYKQDKSNLEKMLDLAAAAYTMLPPTGTYERLPLFSQRVSGNPHAFDIHTIQGKIFLNMLSSNIGAGESAMLNNIEQINDLLLKYGLLRDDLWSFVTCSGLLAFEKDRVHPVWVAAAECNTVLNIPVRELTSLDRIQPLKGHKVYIVENSGVCSALMDELPDKAIVCTHGQFRAASWIFFSLLTKSDCMIYYAGDLDPEGVLMAQRLKKRYPQHVKLWRMDEESYQTALSSEPVADRLTQLKNLDDVDLLKVANAMSTTGYAAYQEGLVDLLKMDIITDTDIR
ncbi:TIGR02679 family protein [Peribacillus deserti]|nr:TIGR02679 family protein [Peribacillus deserti]